MPSASLASAVGLPPPFGLLMVGRALTVVYLPVVWVLVSKWRTKDQNNSSDIFRWEAPSDTRKYCIH
jgi:hypothetical protein